MRYLRSLYRNAGETADLRQDIYAEIVASAQKQIPNAAKPFVFAIARNIVVDRMRRERVIPMDTIADVEKLGLASETPSPDRIIIARDELRQLRAAIEQLPSRCREVVVMARIEGLPSREIAARLNLTDATVSYHLKKGMQLLVDILYGSATLSEASE